MTYEKKFQVSAIVCLLGIILFIIGYLDSWNPVFLVPGAIMFSTGMKFGIAYIYRIKTGKHTLGMRFWIWVFKRK